MKVSDFLHQFALIHSKLRKNGPSADLYIEARRLISMSPISVTVDAEKFLRVLSKQKQG